MSLVDEAGRLAEDFAAEADELRRLPDRTWKRLAEYRSFLLHAGQYRIEDNWHVAGLKGTASEDIEVDDAFVPEHRSQSHVNYALGNPLPGQQANPGTFLVPDPLARAVGGARLGTTRPELVL